jgi:hypothetical protein
MSKPSNEYQASVSMPAAVEPTKKRTRTPRPQTPGDLLLKEAEEWKKECRVLRRALDAIDTATLKGIVVLGDAINNRKDQLAGHQIP